VTGMVLKALEALLCAAMHIPLTQLWLC
jgi:hypothetical protein